MKKQKHPLITGALILTATGIVTRFIGFFYKIFLSRTIGAEGIGIYGETPEEYLCRMETLGELMAVLDTCTEAQRRRFLLYALDGLTLAEIGTVCGCSKVSVYESIDAVRKKFLKFFANSPNE